MNWRTGVVERKTVRRHPKISDESTRELPKMADLHVSLFELLWNMLNIDGVGGGVLLISSLQSADVAAVPTTQETLCLVPGFTESPDVQ